MSTLDKYDTLGLVNLIKKNTDLSELRANFERLNVSVQSTLNPNHRHDEPWEQELDAQREALCASHRMHSFAPVRPGNHVKWHSDGCDYFWALSEIIDQATSHIFILDWWLSPEMYLRRPPHLFEDYRFDRLLKRKALQGVRIFIVVYKEVTQTMTMSSAWTKHYLEDLHPNIQVYRHPDHLGGEVTLMWSHHEKICVVDNTWATVGGLDICYGRWDTQSHPLADVHLTDANRTLFPGQDYNNARIEDFHNVPDYLSNHQSRTVIGRMPWHDVHVSLYGPAVLDVAAHFIQRWNFLKTFKYKGDRRMHYIAFPSAEGQDLDPHFAFLKLHPRLAAMAQTGETFRHPFNASSRLNQVFQPGQSVPAAIARLGSCNVQVLRSSADWSLGILTEHSIQNAYLSLIAQAEHYIYIENQFFITSTQETGQVKNKIGMALVTRIIRAYNEGKKFKVTVVIPTIPCFSGELDKAAGIRAIMGYQYRSISRGEQSIFGQLRRAGVRPEDYISFYHLRSFDRINFSRDRVIEVERRSGVSYFRSQLALARLFNGDSWMDMGIDAKGQAKGPLHNASVKLYNPAVPAPKGASAPQFSGTEDTIPPTAMPTTVAEAEEILARFQAAAREVMSPVVSDSVATSRPLAGGLEAETWPALPVEEVALWVTEEIYVHSKLMIVDDRRVLIGSANLNDRSQVGDRDSEMAILVEDEDRVEAVMNGEPFQASQFAASFRRHLWQQHLGLLPPQVVSPDTAKTFPTPGMKPAPAPNPHPFSSGASEGERLVLDPLGEEVEQIWKQQARNNTLRFDDVFHPVPSDRAASWRSYHMYFPKNPVVTGHVADLHADPAWVREKLSGIKGCLVEFAHHFLEEENLVAADSAEVNKLTLDIYL